MTMRSAANFTAGAIVAWCIIAIWHGPTAWLFTRIEVLTPTDHVDKVRVWHHGVEHQGAWPIVSEETP